MPPDLNIDLGELPDERDELYGLAHRVNVACGGHAGDVESMRRACVLAKQSGALVGAHPSYEDRVGFGRTALVLTAVEVQLSIERQCRTLVGIAAASGVSVAHVKPHGALYHEANRRTDVAHALLSAVLRTVGEVAVIGPPSGALLDAADRHGVAFLREGFADRRYLADGSLAPRSEPDALIDDPFAAAEQARRLVERQGFDTLCVHSDTPDAVRIALAVRAALDGR